MTRYGEKKRLDRLDLGGSSKIALDTTGATGDVYTYIVHIYVHIYSVCILYIYVVYIYIYIYIHISYVYVYMHSRFFIYEAYLCLYY